MIVLTYKSKDGKVSDLWTYMKGPGTRGPGHGNGKSKLFSLYNRKKHKNRKKEQTFYIDFISRLRYNKAVNKKSRSHATNERTDTQKTKKKGRSYYNRNERKKQ